MVTALILLATVALLAFIVIHLVWFIHPSRVESLDDLDHMLGGGQPIVIEFYSNL